MLNRRVQNQTQVCVVVKLLLPLRRRRACQDRRVSRGRACTGRWAQGVVWENSTSAYYFGLDKEKAPLELPSPAPFYPTQWVSLRASYSEAWGKYRRELGRLTSRFLNFTVLLLRFRGLTSPQLKWMLEFCLGILQAASENEKYEQETRRRGQAPGLRIHFSHRWCR